MVGKSLDPALYGWVNGYGGMDGGCMVGWMVVVWWYGWWLYGGMDGGYMAGESLDPTL